MATKFGTVVVIVVVFKLPHLADICTLTSAFYTVSQKNVPLCDCPCLHQILTDFQNFFTGKLCGQVAVM